jgi:hydrogenase maturation protease
MSLKLVDTVVHAVLYEGYILYPYRASAKKNRQRFTFGRVYPETYSVAENNMEPCSMQTQCLIDGPPAAKLEVIVRFLHPMARDIGALAAPLRKLPPPDNPDFFHVVPELEIDGKHFSSWQEAVERAVHLPVDSLFMLRGQTLSFPFNFTATRSIEPIHDAHRHIAGVIVRRQESVTGSVELTVDPLENNISRITVRIVNRTAVPSEVLDDANEIVMRTFASTHTILHAQGAEFPSIIDPPESLTQAAADCRNIGTWPILVGDPRTNERDTLVSSPIILYDYPEIAPESSADEDDFGEMDEAFELRIATMADKEKRNVGMAGQTRRSFSSTEEKEPVAVK